MVARRLHTLLHRAAAWLALAALCASVAVPTLAQALGTPRAAWSELCTTRPAGQAGQVSEPMSDGALLAHLFQHCGDCLTQATFADGLPSSIVAAPWAARAGAEPVPAVRTAPHHEADLWPRALSRAPPATPHLHP